MKEGNFFKKILKATAIATVVAIPSEKVIGQSKLDGGITSTTSISKDTIRDKEVLIKFKDKQGRIPDYVLLTKEQKNRILDEKPLTEEEIEQVNKETDDYIKSPEFKKYLDEEAKKSPEQKKKDQEEFEKWMEEYEKKYKKEHGISSVDSNYIPHFKDEKLTVPEKDTAIENNGLIQRTISIDKKFHQGREFIEKYDLPVGYYTDEYLADRLKNPNRKYGD